MEQEISFVDDHGFAVGILNYVLQRVQRMDRQAVHANQQVAFRQARFLSRHARRQAAHQHFRARRPARKAESAALVENRRNGSFDELSVALDGHGQGSAGARDTR